MKTVPERLATLEERDRHITAQMDKVSNRVDEIYVHIQRGKGAKWVLTGMIAIISWVIGFVFSHKILPF